MNGEASSDVQHWAAVAEAGLVAGVRPGPSLDSAEDSDAEVVHVPLLVGEAEEGALAAGSPGAGAPGSSARVEPPSAGTSAPTCPLSPCAGP